MKTVTIGLDQNGRQSIMSDLITVILLAVAILSLIIRVSVLEVRVRYLWNRFLEELEHGKKDNI